jgi:hypothetical protein
MSVNTHTLSLRPKSSAKRAIRSLILQTPDISPARIRAANLQHHSSNGNGLCWRVLDEEVYQDIARGVADSGNESVTLPPHAQPDLDQQSRETLSLLPADVRAGAMSSPSRQASSTRSRSSLL